SLPLHRSAAWAVLDPRAGRRPFGAASSSPRSSIALAIRGLLLPGVLAGLLGEPLPRAAARPAAATALAHRGAVRHAHGRRGRRAPPERTDLFCGPLLGGARRVRCRPDREARG